MCLRRSYSRSSRWVIRKPERTKKSSTPMPPPTRGRNGRCEKTTTKTAHARNPSSSGSRWPPGRMVVSSAARKRWPSLARPWAQRHQRVGDDPGCGARGSALLEQGVAEAGLAPFVAVVEEVGLAVRGGEDGAVGDRLGVPALGGDVDAVFVVVALPGAAVIRGACEAEPVVLGPGPHRVHHRQAIAVSPHPGAAEGVLVGEVEVEAGRPHRAPLDPVRRLEIAHVVDRQRLSLAPGPALAPAAT